MNARASIPAPTAYYSNLAREHTFEQAEVVGRLPEDLRGTLYRNGPGLMELFGQRYDHLFEGDGAISAFRFSGGKAYTAARVVQSAVLQEERAAGRHLGSFKASWLERLRRIHGPGLKNTANTNLMWWQDRLFALMEGAIPTQVDPETLETLGETDLSGLIRGTFSAHPHYVSSRQTLYNFGLSYGRQTTLDLYALPDAGSPSLLAQLPLDHGVMLHDFAATDKHLVFFVAPIQVVVWRMLLALGPFQDCFRWTPSAGTEIIVVPLDTPDQPIRFHTDPFMQFHFAGAFEDRGEIVVDYCRYEDGQVLWTLGDGLGMRLTDTGDRVPGGRLHRARIDPVKRTFRSEALWDADCEFPRLGPIRECRYDTMWLQSQAAVAGELVFQVTRRTEDGTLTHHRLPRGHLCSEIVPAGSSLLTLVYDCFSERSHLLVLDQENVEEQARIQLTQAIPLTFHGGFIPA